ncbi:MAG: hypothetical protein JWP16_493 [Alphaproteobacteria bacterium]|nr:hypothetical protein [Alphaproteobacteria bacterium]MDB5739453.1 hypothetical protein [Alphaproteobacteria bacterium]
MAASDQADRREFRRYKTSIAAQLITSAHEIVPCTLLDISPTGASVSCEPIADDTIVKLRLSQFGEIHVSRLRAAAGVERLLFRGTDRSIQRMIHFLVMMIDAGDAAPSSHRRQHESAPSRLHRGSRPLSVNESIGRCVDQALSFVQQLNPPGLPDNVVLFPARAIPDETDGPAPDSAA